MMKLVFLSSEAIMLELSRINSEMRVPLAVLDNSGVIGALRVDYVGVRITTHHILFWILICQNDQNEN